MDPSRERQDGVELDALESLLAFWADAGVEALYDTAPQDRTAPRAPLSPPSPTRVEAPSIRASPTLIADPPQSTEPFAPQLHAAVEAAGAAENLDALAAAAERFLASREGGGRLVFKRGDDGADVVVVGGAPDAEDVRQGAPFAGLRGRLLDQMLAAAGFEGRILRLNRVWRAAAEGASAAEQAMWSPFLERALALTRPRAILAVGASAAQGFAASTDSILKRRGSWTPWRGAHFSVSASVLATLDPAVMIDQPRARKLVWQDILTLADRVETQGASDLG